MAAEGTSELAPAELGNLAGEEVPGLVVVVAVEHVEGAVVVERPALGDDVDLGSAAAAELGVVDVGLDLELLDQVDAGGEVHAGGAALLIHDAVDHGVVGVVGHPVGGDAASAVFHVSDGGPLNSGRQFRQLQELAPVQGQFQHLLPLDDFADRRLVGGDDGSDPLDGHLVRDLADLQFHVDPRPLVHLEDDSLNRFGFEAGQHGPNRVLPGIEIHDPVVAILAGDHDPGHAGPGGGDLHLGAWHDRAGLVGNGAEDDAFADLRH